MKKILLILALLLCAGSAQAQDLGVYKGAGTSGVAGVPKFEAWLGKSVPRVLDFLYFTNFGGASDANSPVSLGGWAINSWAQQSRAMTYGVPLAACTTVYTGTCPKYSSFSDIAAGKYDSSYQYLATKLVAKGQANAILRLGWEFNGGWFSWAAAKDPAGFIAAWQHVAGLFRATPGAQFQLDWNPTLGWNQIQADRAYPGDQWVDVIGLDVYCQWWTTADQSDPQHRWQTLVTQNYGLQWHVNFAKAHGKPISFPEWGVGTRPDGHGCGDDPVFVQNMWAWIAQNNVKYHDYWDYPASDYNAQLSNNSKPLAAGAFLAAALATGNYPEAPLDTPTDPDAQELIAARAAWKTLNAVLDK